LGERVASWPSTRSRSLTSTPTQIEADSPEDAIKELVTTNDDAIVVYDEDSNVVYETPHG
jgi:hypothetical protein